MIVEQKKFENETEIMEAINRHFPKNLALLNILQTQRSGNQEKREGQILNA